MGDRDLVLHYSRAWETGTPVPPQISIRIAVSALRDPGGPGHPGGLLQRVQIVKGWVGGDGLFHQRVHEVAGEPQNGARVDPATCEPHGPGAGTRVDAEQNPDGRSHGQGGGRPPSGPGWMRLPGLRTGVMSTVVHSGGSGPGAAGSWSGLTPAQSLQLELLMVTAHARCAIPCPITSRRAGRT